MQPAAQVSLTQLDANHIVYLRLQLTMHASQAIALIVLCFFTSSDGSSALKATMHESCLDIVQVSLAALEGLGSQEALEPQAKQVREISLLVPKLSADTNIMTPHA